MKQIRKLGKAVTVALLAGATISGAAAANLGDYPKPFIDEDGNIDTTLVVGESAKAIDVVGGINIAGSLGNSAYETVSVDVGSATSQWSAQNGITLDSANKNLYYGSSLSSLQSVITGDDLSILEPSEFEDSEGNEVEVEYSLYPGNSSIEFSKTERDVGPSLNVNNPSKVDTSDYLFNLEASFEDSINFTSDSVKGQELELFGDTYTVSTDSSDSKLVLFGSSQEFSVEDGGSHTFTVDENEHTVEVVSVNGASDYTYMVNGNYKNSDSFKVDGNTVRVRNVYDTGDSGQGIMEFSVGSEEVVLKDGRDIEVNGDRVDGTHVVLNEGSGSSPVSGLSLIEIYIGSEDRDHDYVVAGGSFSHSLFDDIRFHFGGLSPDTSEGSEEVSVGSNSDDTLELSVTDHDGNFNSIEFIHTPDEGTNLNLADSYNNSIVAVEGSSVSMDQYVMTDAAGFGHIWKVVDLQVDEPDLVSNGDSSHEATVVLEDVLSGDTMEVDLDADGDGNGAQNDQEYEVEEDIDREPHHFILNTQGTSSIEDDILKITWGSNADFDNTGDTTTAFPSIKTEDGGRTAFYDPRQDPSDYGTNLVSFDTNEKFYEAGTQSPEGSNNFGEGDDIVRDEGGSGTYSDSSDTTLAGTAPSNGDSLTSTNPWSGDTPPVSFHDAGSGTWNPGSENDVIVTDDDSDGAYTGGQDTVLSGTTPSAGVDLEESGQSTDWSSVAFIDDTGSDAWDSSVDTIYEDTTGDQFYNTSQDNVLAGNTPGSDTQRSGQGARSSDWTNVVTYDATDSDVWDSSSDAIVLDEYGDTTANKYSAGPDSNLAGSAPADGTNLVTSNPWSAVMFYDAGTSNAWEPGSDVIVTDDDQDGVYTSQADTLVDSTDGSTDVSVGNSLTGFATSTKHVDDGVNSNQYDSGEAVVDDSGSTSGEFDSGDIVLYGTLTGGGSVQYWSSDSEEVSSVTSGLQSNLPSSKPAAVFIETEADSGSQYSYIMTGSWDSNQVQVDKPTFSDASQFSGWESFGSDSDISASYDVYGVYAEHDSDSQGSLSLFYPQAQSTAGAAFTDSSGSLNASSESIEVNRPTDFPNAANLDSDISSISTNAILIGGPSVNSFVKQLAQDNKTMKSSKYSQGDSMIQLVENAFNNQSVLIVAGYSGSDTVEAANYLASYRNRQDEMSDKKKIMVNTQ